MSIRVSDSLTVTEQRATTADALNGLAQFATVTNQDEAFALALEEACQQAGIDFAIAYSHGANETDFYRDTDFTVHRNAFGLGHPDNADVGIEFDSFRAGARFYVGELLLKLRRPIPPSLADARTHAPEKWDSVERIVGGALGTFPAVSTIADLNKRFGPIGSDGKPRESVWMSDANGPRAIVAKGNALFPALADQQEDTPPMPETKIPTIVLDAGHRSTDRSGNPAEMAMTDDLARAYRAELRRRGFEAYWHQEDLDRDADPDETIGDLNTVAKGLGAWLKTQDWALMLSLHYNGAHSALHAIIPDNVGLSTAYPEGRDPNDTAANNPLDRDVGAAIIRAMSLAGLGSVFRGKLQVAGLMSETETGVGLQGFRLAVFAATAPSRNRAVRLVLEHGGTSDPAAFHFTDFARAAADAIEAVYGKATTTTTTTTPAPSPYPPKRIPAPDTMTAQGHTLTFNEPNRVYATQGQTVRTAPSKDAPAATKTPIKANLKYTFDYRATVDGEEWFVSKAGSWVLARGFKP